jgi:hypothetical protein
MALTLKNFVEQLPKDLLQLAGKNKVRECDETEKGSFVAYVDEGKETFDVSIAILSNGEIGKSACDCKNGATYCRHKAALLLHIVKDQKPKSPLKLKKKADKVEMLLDNVEFSGLKDWVKTLIEKNKEIELSFVHHFSPKSQHYTVEEVAKLVKDAIRATAGTKKEIDATQIKKLVELWAEVLQPVVQYYQANVVDEKAFLAFHILVEQCVQFYSGIKNTSTRITKYVEDLLKTSEAPLSNLQSDESWFKAVDFFLNYIPDGINSVRIHYLAHLKNVIGTASPEKKEKTIDLLASQFKKVDKNPIINQGAYTKLIFDIIEEAGLFPKYYKLLKPIYFDNPFNEKLIRLLIDNNQLELAKKYSEEQIKGNYQGVYDIPYLKFLKEIYTLQNDEVAVANVLTKLLPGTFNFDDYLFVMARILPEEQKKLRTHILSKARNERHSSGTALEFSFMLLDHEKNYRKMIDYIDETMPYRIILKYFEPMVSAHKQRLFDFIIQKSDGGSFFRAHRAEDEDSLFFPELFDMLVKHYTLNYLKIAFRKSTDKNYYRVNPFYNYVTNELKKQP